jgi:hypothetical protein
VWKTKGQKPQTVDLYKSIKHKFRLERSQTAETKILLDNITVIPKVRENKNYSTNVYPKKNLEIVKNTKTQYICPNNIVSKRRVKLQRQKYCWTQK